MCFLDVPAIISPAKRWSARTPRRAAQWECYFWELPALASILGLRGRLGSASGAHGDPAGICAKCCSCYWKNIWKRVTCQCHSCWLTSLGLVDKISDPRERPRMRGSVPGSEGPATDLRWGCWKSNKLYQRITRRSRVDHKVSTRNGRDILICTKAISTLIRNSSSVNAVHSQCIVDHSVNLQWNYSGTVMELYCKCNENVLQQYRRYPHVTAG